ncbi:MAG TPA: 5-formyltetrahydrofolate cyclo-ligase [Candidatus Gastranaerophilaceae bacterium]|nr:5-formyltetrahydrofolate cyclo-ligase [Candidatus Gastranaerophilaceae bacterium]
MIEKEVLRIKCKEIRRSLDVNSISEKIVETIFSLEEYQKALNIMIFYPLEHEINLMGLMNDSSKNFYLPKVKGEKLLVCPYISGDKLVESKFKTKEPETNPVSSDLLDIVFVPAVAAAKNFNRLGYGGGFYDRFLSKLNPEIIKIIAIPDDLIVDNIPCESFDETVNIIVSEKQILK